MATCGPRYADALILSDGETRRISIAGTDTISLAGQAVIVIQAKASRLGTYLMGQAVFSAELIRRFDSGSVRSIALCTEDDSALHPLLASYYHVEVVVTP
jgi:hypothetical protein